MHSPLKVLVLSRIYPNNVLTALGPWVNRLVREITETCEVRVVAPVPYYPPLPGLAEYGRFRKVERQQQQEGIAVYHPRFLVGPGYSLYNVEGLAYYYGVRKLVDQIRRDFPFDLIHAHFNYPDGVAALRLGQRYGVPVIVTEHALWRPWMDQYSMVRRQAVPAARKYD